MQYFDASPSKCVEGIGLMAVDSNPIDPRQSWRFYKNRIANLHCGHLNGNLAITEIEDNSFSDIPLLDHIQFSLGECMNALHSHFFDQLLIHQKYINSEPNKRKGYRHWC